ncbi:uncharacterized protein N0V89_007872 [Didymosphaeria variabile]|uniref:Uncharacterized protein n=1 Tax=Didymosphaeria variabile TaxID=1932322 RepID=A0A9W9CAP9_9PLEO|nr:uncharacterized protein N0V89_007872 [Didymosphaeria variabile]KAJ4352523.1 hypothetical protein N0V89_007872 [Didymosphaeria variabile]
MSGFIGNSEDFSLVGEFVKDIAYHARRSMGYSREERRKQAFEYRLRKLRLRQRRERKRQDPKAVRRVPQVTEFGRSIGQMRAPVRSQEAIPEQYWWLINFNWRCGAFKNDPGMRALLGEERMEGFLLDEGGSGLFVKEFQESPDAVAPRIHRVFRPSNFQNPLLKVKLPEERQHQVWVNMRPALILATKFLLDQRHGAFWYHLMYGTAVTDRATRKSYLMHSPKENDLETAQADFAALLESLADRMSFYWRPAMHNGGHVNAIYGSSFWQTLEEFVDITRWQNLRRRAEGYNGYIGLSSNFLYNLIGRHAPTRTHVEADINIQFLLAVTLTHELAHAIYAWRDLPCWGFQNGQSELFVFDTDMSNEVGWSWEYHTFGGVSLFCDLLHDHIGKRIKARTWESMLLGETSIYTPVPNDWLKSMFMKDTWKHINQHVSSIPKPVGRPEVFVALRYIDRGGQLSVEDVEYKDGLACNPEHQLLNDLEGPVEGCVEARFKRVRKSDFRKAKRTGFLTTVAQRGPRNEVLGKELVVAPPRPHNAVMEDASEDDDASDGSSVTLGRDDDDDSDDGFVDGEDPPEAWDKEFKMHRSEDMYF